MNIEKRINNLEKRIVELEEINKLNRESSYIQSFQQPKHEDNTILGLRI